MKEKKIMQYSLIHAVLTVVYIFLVALLMQNGDKIFGRINDFVGVAAFLLLFVMSATIVGALVLGKPVMLYIDGDKKEGVKMLVFTVLWLLLLLIIAFAVAALV